MGSGGHRSFFFLRFCRVERPHRAASRPRRFHAPLLAAALFFLLAPQTAALAEGPQGEWLLDGRVVVQIFDCSGELCGRVLWLKVPLDPEGRIKLDKNNPNPALRSRQICGLTILWNLQPAGPDRWEDGWIYNPDDGKLYRVDARLESSDKMTARIYLGMPLFGETKTLSRVLRGTSSGWC